MKANIAVDAHSRLVHTIITTAANKSDIEQIADLLRGKEQRVWADSGCRGTQAGGAPGSKLAHRRAPERHRQAARGAPQGGGQKRECRMASVRAKVGYPFRVIKRQFGLMKVRFRGLTKNTARADPVRVGRPSDGMATFDRDGRSPSVKRTRHDERGQDRSKRRLVNFIVRRRNSMHNT